MYVIGDIHGYAERLEVLLRDAALIDSAGHWSGGTATLWFVGDFFDRGPDGVGALALVQRLEHEAAQVGGTVAALLGNHDMMLLAARLFGPPKTGRNALFWTYWKRYGGNERDLERLTDAQAEWLATRPALARVGDTLLAHADAAFYTSYGSTIADVNRAFADVLRSDDDVLWQILLDQFSEHGTFFAHTAALAPFLKQYGCRRLVHGHTPIGKMTRQDARHVHEALVYANGRAINVDGGIYKGGPGFVFRLDAE